MTKAKKLCSFIVFVHCRAAVQFLWQLPLTSINFKQCTPELQQLDSCRDLLVMVTGFDARLDDRRRAGVCLQFSWLVLSTTERTASPYPKFPLSFLSFCFSCSQSQ